MKFIVLIALIFFCTINFSDAGWGKKARLGPKIRRPSIPLIVPVILPGGSYRRYGGLRCYTCQGADNDQCVLNPSSVARRTTCYSNQVCSIVRIEMTPTTSNKPKAANATVVAVTSTTEAPATTSMNSTSPDNSSTPGNTTLDSFLDSILKVEEGNTTEVASSNVTEIVEPSKETLKRASVIVSRGCRPVNFIESTVANGGFQVRKYVQLCSNDLCNYGDGRLQCYQCTGKGQEPCVTKASTVAKVVTCPPSHYCGIAITETTNNITGAVMSIERGCKPISSQNETADDDDENVKTLVQSCSSDLCNGADGLALYLGSNSSSKSGITWPGLIFALLMAYILRA